MSELPSKPHQTSYWDANFNELVSNCNKIFEHVENSAEFFHCFMRDPRNRGPNFDFNTFDIESFCQNLYIDSVLNESQILILRSHARRIWDSLNAQYKV